MKPSVGSESVVAAGVPSMFHWKRLIVPYDPGLAG